MKQNRILIISDLHMPNQHHSAIPFLEKLHKKWKFTKVFQIGDLVDFASVQVERPNDPEVESPIFEIGKATKEITKSIAGEKKHTAIFPEKLVEK